MAELKRKVTLRRKTEAEATPPVVPPTGATPEPQQVTLRRKSETSSVPTPQAVATTTEKNNTNRNIFLGIILLGLIGLGIFFFRSSPSGDSNSGELARTEVNSQSTEVNSANQNEIDTNSEDANNPTGANSNLDGSSSSTEVGQSTSTNAMTNSSSAEVKGTERQGASMSQTASESSSSQVKGGSANSSTSNNSTGDAPKGNKGGITNSSRETRGGVNTSTSTSRNSGHSVVYLFGFDSAEVTDRDGQLTALANQVKATKQQIIIQAFADPTGESGYNQTLSERRASSLKNYLTQRGIDAQLISITGLGETNRYPTNAENRRADITIQAR